MNAIDPGLKNPSAHHVSAGIDRQLAGDMTLSASLVYVRGFNLVGVIDYNPLVPSLGPGRRPEDTIGPSGPIAGTSASVNQYTSFGETWYRGLLMSLSRRYARESSIAKSRAAIARLVDLLPARRPIVSPVVTLAPQ